jgi:hypothetical protein
MHTITEPRTIALGDSVAASAGETSAWSINPATLADVDEIGATYSYRNSWYTFTDQGYYAAGIWMGTSIGTFALHYNRYDQGEWQSTFATGANGSAFRMLDYTIAASYATDILSPLSIAATAKMFTASIELTSDNPATSNAQGVYVDLGVLFSASDILASDANHDSLHAGIAVRNIGGDLLMPSIPDRSSPLLNQWQPIGHMLDAGIEYDLPMLQRDDKTLLRSRILFGLQVLLNDRNNLTGTESGMRANGSAGLEALVYDILALRLGTVIQPVDNVYGDAGQPTFRYGFGINLPLSRIGLDIPLTVGSDYVRVVMRETLADLEAFGVHVAYTAPLTH